MNIETVSNNPKYPAPFVAEVQFKPESKWYNKYSDYRFRSDKISPYTVNNLYLNYLEVEKFVVKELGRNFTYACIWNNTGYGPYKDGKYQKKVYERTENTILLERQISVEWFNPTIDTPVVGMIINRSFEQELRERKQESQDPAMVIKEYKHLLSKNLLR